MPDLLKRQTPFRAAEARAAGITSRKLREMADRGDVHPLGPGLYLPAHSDLDPDLAEITARAPRATLCLTTALAHHGLIDDIPTAYDLAQPRWTYRPRMEAAVQWHEFDAETFDLGRDADTIRGVLIPIYSPERSLADAFRLRGYEGYETANRALRTWLARSGNHPRDLLAVARQLPRTERPLRNALEALL